jgi:outer membrane scaffolding protein for murein synthesis (MipA/OmpV family)
LGLRSYSPSGGILSYGVGSTLILPITYAVTATVLAGYDHIAGDAGNSPLVNERGSKNQALAGLILSYKFGYNSH